MRSERSDNDWERLKNDPDNWIVIPEFGVQPQDVDFIGFSNPIIGPNTKESPFHRAIRVIICGVRGYILKRFKSIAEMNRINDEGKIRAQLFLENDNSNYSMPTGDELCFIRYEMLTGWLIDVIEEYECDKSNCMVTLSWVEEEFVNMMMNAPVDSKSIITKGRRELAKKAVDIRWQKDPKQEHKATVKRCWEAWQNNPDDYPSKAKFAEDMLGQFPGLKSARVITEKWCVAWEAEAEKNRKFKR